MDITLTTPALLFPAISLLLVAYTNRFNTIALQCVTDECFEFLSMEGEIDVSKIYLG
jgi:hypothetical protein